MSSKSKDKKAQRKAEQAAIQQRLNTVRAALVLPDGSVRDLLAEVKPFCRFDRGGVTAELSFFTPATMPEDVRAFVYDLTKLNMEEMYITAGWGWNEAKKKRELYEPDARFIVFRRATTPSDAGADSAVSAATAVPGELLGFGHMKFLVEADKETLYVYEIQVISAVHRCGLGRHLMMVMELLGLKTGMKRIMLTVLKCNTAATEFYTRKMKYVVDESSPSTEVDDDAPYEILSKSLERKPTAAAAGSM